MTMKPVVLQSQVIPSFSKVVAQSSVSEYGLSAGWMWHRAGGTDPKRRPPFMYDRS